MLGRELRLFFSRPLNANTYSPSERLLRHNDRAVSRFMSAAIGQRSKIIDTPKVTHPLLRGRMPSVSTDGPGTGKVQSLLLVTPAHPVSNLTFPQNVSKQAENQP